MSDANGCRIQEEGSDLASKGWQCMKVRVWASEHRFYSQVITSQGMRFSSSRKH